MAVKAKELRYAVALGATGELATDGGTSLDVPNEWKPEHLLLAALVRCSLKSLRHHAGRRNVDVRSTAGKGRALVTKRETDGRYAVVAAAVELVVEIEPELEPEALSELLALAERDCFVGSSLTATLRYGWTVNDRTIDS